MDNYTFLRLLNYPPVTMVTPTEIGYRCAEHVDYRTFSLLFQDKGGGLQVSKVVYACAHYTAVFYFNFITIQHNSIHVGYTQLAQVARCRVHPKDKHTIIIVCTNKFVPQSYSVWEE